MSIKRSQVIALMRGAYRRGQSGYSFIADMKARGLSYRRTDMLGDWRSVSKIEEKTGLMQYVRKDYYPSEAVMAAVTWKISREYMYVIKVESRLRPDEPVTKRDVNIMSDVPLTRAMVEQTVTEKWAEWEDYTAEAIEKMTVWTAVRKTIE